MNYTWTVLIEVYGEQRLKIAASLKSGEAYRWIGRFGRSVSARARADHVIVICPYMAMRGADLLTHSAHFPGGFEGFSRLKVLKGLFTLHFNVRVSCIMGGKGYHDIYDKPLGR